MFNVGVCTYVSKNQTANVLLQSSLIVLVGFDPESEKSTFDLVLDVKFYQTWSTPAFLYGPPWWYHTARRGCGLQWCGLAWRVDPSLSRCSFQGTNSSFENLTVCGAFVCLVRHSVVHDRCVSDRSKFYLLLKPWLCYQMIDQVGTDSSRDLEDGCVMSPHSCTWGPSFQWNAYHAFTQYNGTRTVVLSSGSFNATKCGQKLNGAM